MWQFPSLTLPRVCYLHNVLILRNVRFSLRARVWGCDMLLDSPKVTLGGFQFVMVIYRDACSYKYHYCERIQLQFVLQTWMMKFKLCVSWFCSHQTVVWLTKDILTEPQWKMWFRDQNITFDLTKLAICAYILSLVFCSFTFVIMLVSIVLFYRCCGNVIMFICLQHWGAHLHVCCVDK